MKNLHAFLVGVAGAALTAVVGFAQGYDWSAIGTFAAVVGPLVGIGSKALGSWISTWNK